MRLLTAQDWPWNTLIRATSRRRKLSKLSRPPESFRQLQTPRLQKLDMQARYTTTTTHRAMRQAQVTNCTSHHLLRLTPLGWPLLARQTRLSTRFHQTPSLLSTGRPSNLPSTTSTRRQTPRLQWISPDISSNHTFRNHTPLRTQQFRLQPRPLFRDLLLASLI